MAVVMVVVVDVLSYLGVAWFSLADARCVFRSMCVCLLGHCGTVCLLESWGDVCCRCAGSGFTLARDVSCRERNIGDK